MVNWVALGQVLLFALGTGAVLVSAFSFGLVSLDRYDLGRRTDAASAATVGALIVAALCFAVCVAGVGLGIWALIVK
jgi:hypothetical protein